MVFLCARFIHNSSLQLLLKFFSSNFCFLFTKNRYYVTSKNSSPGVTYVQSSRNAIIITNIHWKYMILTLDMTVEMCCTHGDKSKCCSGPFLTKKINLIRRRQLGTTGRILVTSLENWKVHREESSDSQKCNRTHILGLLPFEPTHNFRIRPCIADLRRKCVRARTFFDVPFLEPSAPGSSTMTSPCLGHCI
jgi:hypothetical protein